MNQRGALTNRIFDIIIIGSGSIGTPAAYYCARAGLSTLVLDGNPSPGQGSNKSAIGGIRATHSDPAKIRLCLRSIEIISEWQDTMGDDLEWYQGGYLFPIYTRSHKEQFFDLIQVQKKLGLDIDWISSEEVRKLIPQLSQEELLGASYSPKDGNASPLLVNHAFYAHAKKFGATFLFNEPVLTISQAFSKVTGVTTPSGTFYCRSIINASGAHANWISKLVGVNVPVMPDSHEAGITEPIQRFFDPMIVDIREEPGSSNFYFYQHATGQIVFCVTPSPNIWGYNIEHTSTFLPQVSRRLIKVIPALSSLRVRRTWRGLYPMTPDGYPILGTSCKLPEGFIQAVGMCGQGFMLGPGIGEMLARMLTGQLTLEDQNVLTQLSPDRKFASQEMLK